MKKQRPVNLDIGTIKLPITSYVSIIHRLSGIMLFFAIGLFIWLLDSSLASEESFSALREGFSSPLCSLLLWVALSGLAYHFVAGVRHLFMDMGIGESLEGGRLGAIIVIVVSIILILTLGVWIWV